MTLMAGTRGTAATISMILLLALGGLQAAAQGIREDQLRWGWAIEKNKGQLVALAVARRSGVVLPKGSAAPLASQVQAFAGSLKAKDPLLLATLVTAVSRVDGLVKGKAGAERLEAAVAAAIRAHDRALAALIPPEIRAHLQFQAAMVARLIADGVDEYEEWLDGREAADWFQAWGLVRGAQGYWRLIAPQVRQRWRRAAAEVDERMAMFSGTLTSAVPPRAAPAIDPGELEEAATDIAASLSEVTGTAVAPRWPPAENVRIAAALLAQARSAYRVGAREMGVELVYAAYYDHYEGQRAGASLRAVAPDLERQIGPGLRQLRQRMLAGAPRAEVDGIIARLLLALAKAQEALKRR